MVPRLDWINLFIQFQNWGITVNFGGFIYSTRYEETPIIDYSVSCQESELICQVLFKQNFDYILSIINEGK